MPFIARILPLTLFGATLAHANICDSLLIHVDTQIENALERADGFGWSEFELLRIKAKRGPQVESDKAFGRLRAHVEEQIRDGNLDAPRFAAELGVDLIEAGELEAGRSFVDELKRDSLWRNLGPHQAIKIARRLSGVGEWDSVREIVSRLRSTYARFPEENVDLVLKASAGEESASAQLKQAVHDIEVNRHSGAEWPNLIELLADHAPLAGKSRDQLRLMFSELLVGHAEVASHLSELATKIRPLNEAVAEQALEASTTLWTIILEGARASRNSTDQRTTVLRALIGDSNHLALALALRRELAATPENISIYKKLALNIPKSASPRLIREFVEDWRHKLDDLAPTLQQRGYDEVVEGQRPSPDGNERAPESFRETHLHHVHELAMAEFLLTRESREVHALGRQILTEMTAETKPFYNRYDWDRPFGFTLSGRRERTRQTTFDARFFKIQALVRVAKIDLDHRDTYLDEANALFERAPLEGRGSEAIEPLIATTISLSEAMLAKGSLVRSVELVRKVRDLLEGMADLTRAGFWTDYLDSVWSASTAALAWSDANPEASQHLAQHLLDQFRAEPRRFEKRAIAQAARRLANVPGLEPYAEQVFTFGIKSIEPSEDGMIPNEIWIDVFAGPILATHLPASAKDELLARIIERATSLGVPRIGSLELLAHFAETRLDYNLHPKALAALLSALPREVEGLTRGRPDTFRAFLRVLSGPR